MDVRSISYVIGGIYEIITVFDLCKSVDVCKKKVEKVGDDWHSN